MLVEDNPDLLLNLKIILENHNFQVIEATNGNHAIKKLSQEKNLPDIILSDIMMPDMNGYELLKTISSIPLYSHIPFIFLSAFSYPTDIEYGKLLGADDYLTKPFEENELIHIIKEKVNSKKLSHDIYEQFKEKIQSSKNLEKITKKFANTKEIYLILAFWDDKYGPKIKEMFPKDLEFPLKIDEIAIQLFHAANLIYGHGDISKSESILLSLTNIHSDCFILLDFYPAIEERHGKKIYILAVLAPLINYLDSLSIKKILREISQNIKKKDELDFKEYWDRIKKSLY